MQASREDVRFSYPDLFRVIQYTLDLRRLLLQALGLGVALTVLGGALWLSERYFSSLTFFPWFIVMLGGVIFYLTILVFAGPVTWLILHEIRGGGRGTIADAFRHGLGFGFRLAAAPAGILSFILAAAALLIILTITGMIPGVGPLLWALLFLPRFAAAGLFIVGGLTLLAATLIFPSLIVDEQASASGAFRQLARLMRRNFLTFWGYVFTCTFLTVIYFLLFSLVVFVSLRLLMFTSGAILAEEPGRVILSVPAFFQRLTAPLAGLFSFPDTLPAPSGIYSAAGTIWGISLLCLAVAWLSYPVLYLFNSGVIIYLALTGRTGVRRQFQTEFQAAGLLPQETNRDRNETDYEDNQG